MRSEKIQSVISYATGGTAMASPAIAAKIQASTTVYDMYGNIHNWISLATDIFQFLTVFVGFLVVAVRLKYDLKKLMTPKKDVA